MFGRYMIVGSNGAVWSSTDATNWTAESSAATVEFRGFGWNGQQKVLIGGRGGAILTAPLSGYQRWLSTNFNGAQLEDSALIAPGADPDGDGRNNLLEHALGRSPTTPDANAVTMTTQRLDNDWVYTYSRPADRAEINYSVEISTDLTNWNANQVAHTRTSTDGTTETWEARYPAATAPILFFRLKVTQ